MEQVHLQVQVLLTEDMDLMHDTLVSLEPLWVTWSWRALQPVMVAEPGLGNANVIAAPQGSGPLVLQQLSRLFASPPAAADASIAKHIPAQRRA